MSLTLPYPTYAAFTAPTVHSHTAHNVPHAGLLSNDIAIKAYLDATVDPALSSLSSSVASLVSAGSIWNQKQFATSGFQDLPSGLIIQWSYGYAMSTETTQNVGWAKQFPNACLTAQVTAYGTTLNPNTDAWFKIGAIGPIFVQVFLQATGSGLSQPTTPYIFGVGY